MNVNEKLPPPRQDSNLWGHRLFAEIKFPADWCTVGQAAEHLEAGIGSGGDPYYELTDEEVQKSYDEIPSNFRRVE